MAEHDRFNDLSPQARDFYCRTMRILAEAGVPFLVGGAYAYGYYTGIVRNTKDFDLFLSAEGYARSLDELAAAGSQVERCFPHWLGKACQGEDVVDLIFSSGNGLTPVDDLWFQHAPEGKVLGMAVRLCPVEEMIWSKSFIMERERFDGADVAHLLHCCAERLDWARLVARFGSHWRVLLSHLILFGYIYPSDADRIPRHVSEELLARLASEIRNPEPADPICRGTVLSRAQYLFDLEASGYSDARLPPDGNMSEKEVELWTAAIADDGPDAKR
ncbi:MAG TPA: hypothetical protein VHQ90_02730 [Thermoanaerobaculia bacterium]|nr:hypothetical protein [Thermoanaerobaculia bacterium]